MPRVKRLTPDQRHTIRQMWMDGASYKEILAQVDTTESNIWKITRDISDQKGKGIQLLPPQKVVDKVVAEKTITDLGEFKRKRADEYADIGRLGTGLLKRWVWQLHGYDPAKLTIQELTRGATEVAKVVGIMSDKERLERGQSTENVHVIVEAIEDLKKRRAKAK